MLLCHLLIFFFKFNVFKEPSKCQRALTQIWSDLAQHYVGPDLGPKCLKSLPADDKVVSRHRIDFIF